MSETLSYLWPFFLPDSKTSLLLFFTGSVELDQFLVALIGNSPFVGGFVGFFLDLTLPGRYFIRLIIWKVYHAGILVFLNIIA